MVGAPRSRIQTFERRIKRHRTRKRVICFGDSWFQLPGLSKVADATDIHKALARKYDIQAESAVFLGAGIAGRDRSGFAMGIQDVKSLLQKYRIDFLLISHGGNDVIGDEFPKHLKCPGDHQDVVNQPFPRPIPRVVSDYLRLGTFDRTLQSVSSDLQYVIALRDKFSPDCKVVFHNYSQIMPSNRPWRFHPFPVSNGPWVSKPLNRLGLTDRDEQRKISDWMLHQFALRLDQLVHHQGHRNVFLVDTEKVLGDPLRYKKLWSDEIHPSPSGVQLLLEKGWAPLLEDEGILSPSRAPRARSGRRP